MIKVNKGKVMLKGRVGELVKEYQFVTEEIVCMLEKVGMEKEQIKKMMFELLETEFMTPEEIWAKLEERQKELFDKILNKIEKMSKDEEGGADNE